MSTELVSQQKNFSSEAPEAKGDQPALPLVAHLEELRKRLLIAVAAIVVGSIGGFYLSEDLIEWLKRPAGNTLPRLSFFSPAEALIAYFKIALTFGVAIAFPVLLYEFWAFIRPALTIRERRYGFGFVISGTLLFLTGAAFAYWILLPPSLKFLIGFGSRNLQPVISINHYLSFTATVILACGIVFEFPLAIFFLTKLGAVTPRLLRRNWKMAYLSMIIVAAMVTPTQDPVNLILMALPLLFLYEISTLVSYLAMPRRKENV